MLTLGHLLEALSEYRSTGNEPDIGSVVIDSRGVRQRDVFVAFRGEQRDGHDFVEHAFDKGAIAVLAERPVVDDVGTIDLRSGPENADMPD